MKFRTLHAKLGVGGGAYRVLYYYRQILTEVLTVLLTASLTGTLTGSLTINWTQLRSVN